MRFLAVAALLAALGAAPVPVLPAAFVPPPILMYHRIDDSIPPGRVGRALTVTPQNFEAQLRLLRERGLRGISVAELSRRLRLGLPLDHTVVLTFDDGYSDQYWDARPLLARYGDGATFFVVTGTLGTPRHLTWGELRQMVREGLDIDAHGVQHDDLSLMSGTQQAAQIEDSVRLLRARLGVPAGSYCYPSGRFNRETLRLVQGAGIDLAFTTDPSYVIAPEDRLELPRIRVLGSWTAAELGQALDASVRAAEIVHSGMP